MAKTVNLKKDLSSEPIDTTLTTENTRLKEENKSLRKQIKVLHIEASKKRPQIEKTSPKRKGKPKNVFYRVVIPDTHGGSIDKEAWASVLTDIKAIDPHEIVMLGDHVGCDGFLAEHHVITYLSQSKYSYTEDIEHANHHLDELQKVSPNASIHYIEGNHETRVERWINDVCRRSDKDREFLRKALAPEYLLSIKERGIKYYRRSEFYNVSLPGAIKLGKCVFVHDAGHGGKNAARTVLDTWATNVVFGHTHKGDEARSDKPGTGPIGSFNPGCLCERQPLWNHSKPGQWTHGYGLQVVCPSGLFQHINVGILEGQSTLSDFVERLS